MVKKVISLLTCAAYFLLLLCACQAHKSEGIESPSQTLPTEAVQTDAAEPEASQWETAYLDYLETHKDDYLTYALISIDDDGIPELYLSGNCEATGDWILTFKNSALIEQPLNRIGGGQYIERSGDLINQNGNMGHIYTHVYKLTEDGFLLTFSALSAERFEPLGNGESRLSYEYFVGDVQVTEEEYRAAVDAAFCFEDALPLNENEVDYETIRQQITDYGK